MPRVYLGLGSNVEPEANLALCAAELRRRFRDVVFSPVYRNRAVGFEGDDFLNAVAAMDTDLSPEALSAELKIIQRMGGRRHGDEPFAARTLDVDLLLYDGQVIDAPPVQVPRPDVLEYGFVLGPLADIAADLVHPLSGRTIGWHWARFDTASHPLTPDALVL